MYFTIYKNRVSPQIIKDFNKEFNANLSVDILNFWINAGIYDIFAKYMEEEGKKEFFSPTKEEAARKYYEKRAAEANLTREFDRVRPLFRLKQRQQRVKTLVFKRTAHISTNRQNRAPRAYRSPSRQAASAAKTDDGGGDGGGDPDSSDSPPKQAYHLALTPQTKKKYSCPPVSVAPPRLLSHGFSGREAA